MPLNPTASIDAFSRLRVSNPTTVWDSKFAYDLQPLLFEETTTGSGTVTHLPDESTARLTVADSGVGTAALQSRPYIRYTPGKSQLLIMTGVMGARTAGVTRRMGLFDDENGVFMESAPDGTFFVVRSNASGTPVDTRYEQASWTPVPLLVGDHRQNLPALDLDKGQILVIDFQWLGMGRVRFGFDIQGEIVWCHDVNHANLLTKVYMTTADLPVRWTLSGDGSATANVKATCSTIQSEGGADHISGFQFGHSGGVVAGNGSDTLVAAYRPAGTFNSVPVRFPFQFSAVNGSVTGTAAVRFTLWYNENPTGGSWGAVNGSSGMQVNTTAALTGNGVPVLTWTVPSDKKSPASTGSILTARYPFVLAADGTAYGNLTLTARGLGATSQVYTDIAWEEVR